MSAFLVCVGGVFWEFFFLLVLRGSKFFWTMYIFSIILKINFFSIEENFHVRKKNSCFWMAIFLANTLWNGFRVKYTNTVKPVFFFLSLFDRIPITLKSWKKSYHLVIGKTRLFFIWTVLTDRKQCQWWGQLFSDVM